MKCLCIVLILCILTGCSYALELDELGFYHVLAADCGAVTTVSHPDDQDKPPVLRTGRGATPPAALADAGRGNEQMPFLGGVSHLLIGDALGGEDLNAALDMVFRDYSSRMDVYVFLVRDGKASEWAEAMAGSSQSVLDWLHNYEKKTKLGSPALKATVTRIVSGLAEEETVLIPSVGMPFDAGVPAGADEESGKRLTCRPAGYAVARDNRVVAWVEPEDCPVLDALRMGKERLAKFDAGGMRIEAELSRKGRQTLRAVITHYDRHLEDPAAVLEGLLRDSAGKVRWLLEGMERVVIEVEVKP